MNTPIKILHIDPDFKITYFIKHPGGIIRSLISTRTGHTTPENR